MVSGQEGAGIQPQGVSGRSRDGRALARHRAPAPDIAPWIARLFVTVADQPDDHTLECGIFNDTSFVRILVRGDWVADSADGPVPRSRGPLLFGPHTRRMPTRVTGPFAMFGFSIRPGALAALGHPWGEVGTDRLSDIPALEGWAGAPDSAVFDADDADHWLDRLESSLRETIARIDAPPPHEIAEALDLAAFADPTEPIATFATRHRVSPRQVARIALRDFGMPAKQVMRRARVLDMASQLLGFADREEAEEHAMRFYDQSHQIREFRALVGMTPRQLAARPQPILTLSLEPRQARRLEALGRLDSGQPLPWR